MKIKKMSRMSISTFVGVAVIVSTQVAAADYLPLGLLLQAGSQQPVTPPADGATGAVDAADPATQTLASAICQQTKALGDNATAVDIEAAIVFAITQSTVSDAVKAAALNIVPNMCPGGAGQATALANARLALANGRLNGTGALAGGNAGASGFSSPQIDVSGGSVNYTNS